MENPFTPVKPVKLLFEDGKWRGKGSCRVKNIQGDNSGLIQVFVDLKLWVAFKYFGLIHLLCNTIRNFKSTRTCIRPELSPCSSCLSLSGSSEMRRGPGPTPGTAPAPCPRPTSTYPAAAAVPQVRLAEGTDSVDSSRTILQSLHWSQSTRVADFRTPVD